MNRSELVLAIGFSGHIHETDCAELGNKTITMTATSYSPSSYIFET